MTSTAKARTLVKKYVEHGPEALTLAELSSVIHDSAGRWAFTTLLGNPRN